MSPEARRTRTIVVFAVLGLLVAVAATAFMTLGAQGRWDFVLPFRGKKLLALVLVAYAIAVSTVLFQTVVNNRILTPSIMGFDALYVLIQTVLMFSLGATRVASNDSDGIERAIDLLESALKEARRLKRNLGRAELAPQEDAR